MNFERDDLVIIRWLDTLQDPKWNSLEKMEEEPDAECVTVGLFYKKDKRFIYLSHTVSKTERDKTTIPLGCIIQTEKVDYVFRQTKKIPKASNNKRGAKRTPKKENPRPAKRGRRTKRLYKEQSV